ncbi:MAG: chemotaxis protein CheD [Roseivivax sp.]|nr:chemotaxis protein CheD [Roseivivax sp.]
MKNAGGSAFGSTISVIQGEFKISNDPEVILSTVLGSCIAACLHDPVAQIGGMNHFLLPNRDGADSGDIRYGAHAMELLINGLLKQGAHRDRMQAKLFGGASMAANLRDIGRSNAAFAQEFLRRENLPIVSESVGGQMARRVRFWPTTGKAQQLLIPNNPDLQSPAISAPPRSSEPVTLF